MSRVIATGDLHPSSKAAMGNKIAIDPSTGLNQRLTDLRKSLAFMLEVATDRDRPVDAILVSGDVFDNSNPDSSEIDVIIEWVVNVSTAGILMVFISGNHDISKAGSAASALVSLRSREGVIVMEKPGVTMLTPGGQLVRICGLPHPSKNFLLANEEMAGRPPEEVTRTINYNLKRIIQGFDVVQDDIPTILMAHGSTIDAVVGVQPRSLQNDIFIPMDECRLFDAVCLSHIHGRQQVADNAWFSGSLVRNDFGEGPEEKGFNIVEVEIGQPARVEFIGNPHARQWITLSVDGMRQMMLEPIGGAGLQTVWRVKDTLPPAQIEQARDAVSAFTKRFPYVSIDIKPVTEVRVRDEFMADMPSTAEAVQRWLDQRDPDEAGPIDSKAAMEKHQQITEEVGI